MPESRGGVVKVVVESGAQNLLVHPRRTFPGINNLFSMEVAMSSRRPVLSHTIATKTLVTITFSLIVVVSICTLSTLTRALAATIVSDDFNDNSIDTAKWDPNNLASGPVTDLNVPIAETGKRLRIGPLLQNVNGFSYRGLSTINTYVFDNSSAYVELVQAPAVNTNADAAFSVCSDFNDCYRINESAGNLTGVRRTAIGRGAVEAVLFSIPYDTTNHRFLRIRNDAGNLYLETAPGTGGVPGTWTQQYTEVWNSQIVTSAVVFELKGGTSQVEANAPGRVIFDNFVASTP